MSRTLYRGWDGKKLLPEEDLTMSPKHRKWLGKIDVELIQCTGFKDKNNKLVYKGDLFEYGCKRWRAWVEYNVEKGYGWCLATNGYGFMPIADVVDMEIIGSVFGNPKLLPKAKTHSTVVKEIQAELLKS
jgi:hypothetical protein